jgi:hypothetical protein
LAGFFHCLYKIGANALKVVASHFAGYPKMVESTYGLYGSGGEVLKSSWYVCLMPGVYDSARDKFRQEISVGPIIVGKR